MGSDPILAEVVPVPKVERPRLYGRIYFDDHQGSWSIGTLWTEPRVTGPDSPAAFTVTIPSDSDLAVAAAREQAREAEQRRIALDLLSMVDYLQRAMVHKKVLSDVELDAIADGVLKTRAALEPKP